MGFKQRQWNEPLKEHNAILSRHCAGGEHLNKPTRKEGMIEGKAATRQVFIDGWELQPRASQQLRNHSPDGFMWGYGGSGPAQLALALLLHFSDKETAQKHYQEFKWDVIAKLNQTEDFKILNEEVIRWIEMKEKKNM